MARKVLLDIDPGIADTLALCLALADPELEVVAVTATGGNTTPRQASRNVQALVEQLDPARLPRIGAADEQQTLRTDGRQLSGSNGLCGADFGVAELHNRHLSSRVISEEIRAAPGEVTVIAGGPLSNLATALQRDPDIATQIGHLVFVGGTLNGRGNVSPAAEFNVFCDAEAARLVLNSPVTKTMLPLEVTTKAVLHYGLLDLLPDESDSMGRVLRAVLPVAFRAFHQQLGMEGLYVPEAVAVAAVLHPGLITTKPLSVDVETSGELTHGATVVDHRSFSQERPNCDVAVELDADGAIDCILRGIQRSR